MRGRIAIALCAIAMTSCGGSSGSSSSTDTSAAHALTAGGAAASTPLDGTQYRELITRAATQKGLSPEIAAKVADCVVSKETAQGYRTVADLARSTAARRQVVQDAVECTAQALPAG